MIERYRKIQRQRAAGEVDVAGFTLIELLIVIVVLGILAAVVVFALGGVTGQSAVSACNADAKTVEVAVAAFEANNGGSALLTNADAQGLLTGTTNGGPYLQSWPNNSGANYVIDIDDPGDATATTGTVDVTVGSGGTPTDYNSTPNPCASASTS